LAAMVRYRFNDNMSVIGGLKRVSLNDGATLRRPIAGVTADGSWTMSSASTTGGVLGVSYEDPSIALRVTLLTEAKSSLSIDTAWTHTDAGVGTRTGTGKTEASAGDATTLSFQTGIAPNTLLFGNVRVSSWKNNQISVPRAGGSSEVSTFEDGTSYTLGLGRKFSDKLSGSVSYFSDPASDCDAVSALSPVCENTSINLGAKYSLSESADLSLGTTWTQYGDATVANMGGTTTTKSTKTSYGFKLSYKF